MWKPESEQKCLEKMRTGSHLLTLCGETGVAWVAAGGWEWGHASKVTIFKEGEEVAGKSRQQPEARGGQGAVEGSEAGEVEEELPNWAGLRRQACIQANCRALQEPGATGGARVRLPQAGEVLRRAFDVLAAPQRQTAEMRGQGSGQ